VEIRRKEENIGIEIRLAKDIIIGEWKYAIEIVDNKVDGEDL
jgi:hypothetical protein